MPPSAFLLLPRYKGAGGKTTLVCQIPAHDIGLLNHNAFAEQGPTRVLAREPKPRRFGRWVECLGELEKRQWSMVSGEKGWRPRQQPRAELRGVLALRRNAEASRQLLQRCGSDRCGGRPSARGFGNQGSTGATPANGYGGEPDWGQTPFPRRPGNLDRWVRKKVKL